ncbi:uncharacterized protein LOC106467308 [Limulus polyphemus]|uniref:Uncharacterized protein LOC106467308 n=1 Tax=Limulus polyphemus TaxID=6850 RepID=A0ABM1T5L9_LIMPO|nr:uncharacterized protein LOC106467308 [Limulus polyphemus]XP_013783104.1 uncharacterized protein LOC106467308 [Limulus polyphemus]XP_013783105.1 uncharacterized protein LOC106467308 [Limulus polyphemus]XP_022251174.1 uncharacterized protein LOC106467308 [Limulus polyphemus]XP_022251175.1 uncharacterized protein LOC106467308 [Limulus polyphemus]
MTMAGTHMKPSLIKCPSSFVETTVEGDIEDQLYLEDVLNGTKELWLLQVPLSMDSTLLDNKEISLKEETSIPLTNSEDKHIEFAPYQLSKELDSVNLVLPSRSSKQIVPVPTSFHGQLLITEGFHIPPPVIPPTKQQNRNVQFPEELLHQFVPFGADEPFVSKKTPTKTGSSYKTSEKCSKNCVSPSSELQDQEQTNSYLVSEKWKKLSRSETTTKKKKRKHKEKRKSDSSLSYTVPEMSPINLHLSPGKGKKLFPYEDDGSSKKKKVKAKSEVLSSLEMSTTHLTSTNNSRGKKEKDLITMNEEPTVSDEFQTQILSSDLILKQERFSENEASPHKKKKKKSKEKHKSISETAVNNLCNFDDIVKESSCDEAVSMVEKVHVNPEMLEGSEEAVNRLKNTPEKMFTTIKQEPTVNIECQEQMNNFTILKKNRKRHYKDEASSPKAKKFKSNGNDDTAYIFSKIYPSPSDKLTSKEKSGKVKKKEVSSTKDSISSSTENSETKKHKHIAKVKQEPTNDLIVSNIKQERFSENEVSPPKKKKRNSKVKHNSEGLEEFSVMKTEITNVPISPGKIKHSPSVNSSKKKKKKELTTAFESVLNNENVTKINKAKNIMVKQEPTIMGEYREKTDNFTNFKIKQENL